VANLLKWLAKWAAWKDAAPLPESVRLLLEAYPHVNYYGALDLKATDYGRSLLASSPGELAAWVKDGVAAIRRIEASRNAGESQGASNAIGAAITALLRRKLPLDEHTLEALLLWVAETPRPWLAPRASVLTAIERHANDGPLDPVLVSALESLKNRVNPTYGSDERKLHGRVLSLLSEGPDLLLNTDEPWAQTATDHVESLDDARRAQWLALFTHCQKATAGKPSKKWQKSAAQLVDDVGRAALSSALVEWLPLLDKPRAAPPARWSEWMGNWELMLDDTNVDILKGLIWCTAGWDAPDCARVVGAAAISAYKATSGSGPREIKLGNACVWALGQMVGEVPLGALAVLKTRVKHGSVQNGIEKALNAVAERTGISRDELEELAVPTYGMTGVGRRVEQLGEFEAELMVTGSHTTQLAWIKPNGKRQKSVPKSVKEGFPEELRALKQASKDIKKLLPSQRDRIERLFLAQRRWPAKVWRERYLDHPLVGTLARRLIWWVDQGAGRLAVVWDDGALRSVDGREELPSNDATVSLWHPLDTTADATIAWRDRLAERGIQQPFKQASREVYLLTDAERRTEVYSNRFASHIIKQHQFNALCKARGWRNELRLMVDDDYGPASMQLPAWDLGAEFWVEGVGDVYGVDTNETGTFLYLSTDQVRFYSLEAQRDWIESLGNAFAAGATGQGPPPLRLEAIPELVLSEVMRDVDLFVGVASVGNDPTWSDGGREGRHLNYWHATSFGDLGETARTRKAVLERLIPRLKIASRCHLADRFLVVRGDLRTYKIHLGSSNILMEPNDQYLCIVSAQGKATPNVFLPFEGDNRLSVILSKAMLLAADTTITDPTILSQLQLR